MVLRAFLMKSDLIQVSDGLGPQKKLIFLSNVQGNLQIDLQDKGVIDSGCSRHMTGNMSYLTDYEEIDGGYVAFGGNPKGGKIIGKVPRKNNMYSVDLKNIVPKGGLTCLFAKATSDESKLWHRRLGHLNFKTMNKLVKGNLVRGLPSKLFENDQTCVACQKGKQHRASCKSKTENSISLPLHLLHMDLFGPTFVKSLMKKMYCLVVTDDYSRFTWVFFLATKDETSGILKSFITGIENLVDHKVKVIRSRTPQQNRVAERRNMTLIEAARTMLADSKLPTTFWAEAVNTACYVQNRVFSESTPNVVGSGPDWLFDIDALTRIINYEPIVAGTQSNVLAGTKASDNASQARKETEHVKDYILLPLWTVDPPYSQDPKSSHDDGSKPSSDDGKKVDEDPRKESKCNDQEKEDNINSTNNVNAAGTNEVNAVGGKTSIELPFDPNMHALEDYSIFDFSKDDEDDGAMVDINNLDTTIQVSPIPTTRIYKDHPLDQVIGDLQSATQIRKMSKNLEEHGRTQKGNSCIEGSKLARGYAGRASTIQDTRSLDFKKDEMGIMIRNKARLVAQRYTQEEVIDYDEVFAPVARIEAIRLFLAYASFKDFMGYQMDVKSAFLYGKIEEEMYVCQPLGFKDSDFPDRVYKVEKALPMGFKEGKLTRPYSSKGTKMSSRGELTFFLGLQVQQKRHDIFISQYKYVAGILKKFGFTEVKTASTPMETQKPLLKDEDCEEVDVHMYRYQVILRLISWQCKKQTVVANSITKAEYVVASSCCGQNKQMKSVRLMMGILFGMELELMLCLSPKTTAWNEFSSTMASAIICLATNQKFNFSKFIFDSMIRNLDNLSGKFLMYPRFVQIFLDQQLDGMPTHKRIYIAPSHTKKIFGNMRRVGKGFSGRVTPLFQTMVVQNQSQLGEGSAIPTDPHHTPTFIQPSTQPQKTQQPRKPKRKDTQVPQPSDPIENVADEAVHKELGDSLVRAATTASSLEAEQDIGNINKTQSKATPNESSSQGTNSGGGPRCQETMGDTIAQTRFENVSKHSNDSLLARGNTLRSDEDRLKLDELMALFGLTARVESSDNEESLGEDASKQGRIDAIDADEEITLVSVQNVDEEMFDVNVLDGEEVFVAEQEVAANKENDEVNVVEEVVEVINAAGNVVSTAGDATTVSAATETTDDDGDITLAQALIEMKSTKPKVKWVVIQELDKSTPTISSQQSQDKGKGILIEPVKPMKRKDQIRLDEETALNFQAKFDEEERLAREKAEKEEANISLIETCDDIQAKIDADHQLAERLQAQEQEELSIEEKATLFQQLLDKRRKHFAAKRAEEKRNKPPTKAQQRKIMCNYLKNMEGYKLKDLKLKEFDSIQEMFDRAFIRVNTFEDFRTELGEIRQRISDRNKQYRKDYKEAKGGR
ncbi:putative ribonuclease H-like domain-containing protein [Tanacetum coccineum]